MKIILAPIVLIVAWDLFVIVSANQPRPWLWVVRRPHYEVTFSIEMPDGVHTASGVVAAVYFADPAWDQTIPPLPLFGLGQVVGTQLNGEATTMCLPDGSAVSMALDHQFQPLSNAPSGPTLSNSILSLADELLTQSQPQAFTKIKVTGTEWRPYITAFSVGSISGAYQIPDDRIPAMIFFENGANVHSARLFDPKDAERWLGPGAKFRGATLSLSDAPITSDADKCLPWLKQYEWWIQDAPHRPWPPRPDSDDPIAREMNYPLIGGVWHEYFLYRSSM